jgi:hypothetical protein
LIFSKTETGKAKSALTNQRGVGSTEIRVNQQIEMILVLPKDARVGIPVIPDFVNRFDIRQELRGIVALQEYGLLTIAQRHSIPVIGVVVVAHHAPPMM